MPHMMRHRIISRALVAGLLLAIAAAAPALPQEKPMTRQVMLNVETPSPQVSFALGRLRKALGERGIAVVDAPAAGTTLVHVGVISADMAARMAADGCASSQRAGNEAFSIRRGVRNGNPAVWVAGGDAAGAMYGVLELAELIAGGADPAGVPDRDVAPRFPFRGVKFNLPWMSYRRHPSLQLHSEVCRDMAFWQAFLDMMAENRLNVLSLWNLHPFHLMIRPKDFPEACDMTDEELARWQEFWRTLMDRAHDRGIQVHLFFWNIFVSPAFARARNVAKYSIDWSFFGNGDTSELVQKYNRQCVTQLIDEYPGLDGLGVAMSERMGGMTPEERGKWIYDTIVAGIKAARRPVQFNLRVPHSANTGSGGSMNRQTEILGRKLLEELDLPVVWTEIKFNWSHGHSTPRLCIIHGGRVSDVLWNPPPAKYRILWMVRNEDFFILRWGDPQFVREHIRLNGHKGVGGYFIGSECYIPAVDYITRADGPQRNWKYAFERQWLFYMVWGRLLYDPSTPDDVFASAYEQRYGRVNGRALLEAMARASRVPQRIATFVGFTWDHTLYTEGFLAGGNFITVDRLRKARPVDEDWTGVEQFVSAGGKVAPGRVSPLEVADAAEADARTALKLVENINGGNGPLAYEVADIRAWSHLGLHFAAKLRAAVALAEADAAGDAARRKTARNLLEQAAAHWNDLAAITSPLYREIPLQHTGERLFSWQSLREKAASEAQSIGPQ